MLLVQRPTRLRLGAYSTIWEWNESADSSSNELHFQGNLTLALCATNFSPTEVVAFPECVLRPQLCYLLDSPSRQNYIDDIDCGRFNDRHY